MPQNRVQDHKCADKVIIQFLGSVRTKRNHRESFLVLEKCEHYGSDFNPSPMGLNNSGGIWHNNRVSPLISPQPLI
jgi:hypothetical protein